MPPHTVQQRSSLAEGTRYMDRREWIRFLFYLDLVVIATFVASTVLLVVNAYQAGYELQFTRYAESHRALWRVVVATGFMVASMAWIFFRFFQHQYRAMQRPPY